MKQTNKQTDRHYENNGHLAVNRLHYDAHRLTASLGQNNTVSLHILPTV